MAKLSYFKDIRDWSDQFRARGVRRIVRVALPLARKRLQAIKEIKSGGLDIRQDLRSRLIHCAAQVALLEARKQRVLVNYSLPLTVGLMILVFLTPLAIIKWVGASYNWLALFGIWYAALAGFAVISVVLLSPFALFKSSAAKWVATLIGLFWSVFGLVTCGYMLYFLYPHLNPHIRSTEPSWYLVVAASSITQIFVYATGAVPVVLVEFVVSMVLSAREVVRAPDALFVDKIVRALEIVGRTDRSWLDLDAKNNIMRELEEAARIVSRGLPGALSTADPYTDTWLRNRCEGIAASLRAKKTWVCMPRPDTREQLVNSLTKCLIDAVSGNWDSIEIAESRELSHQETKVRIRKFLTSIFVALLPAAFYRGAQSLGLLVPGVLSEYLGFGVVLWAVIAILLAVDPRFGEKIEAVQKITSMLPGFKKKEG